MSIDFSATMPPSLYPSCDCLIEAAIVLKAKRVAAYTPLILEAY